MKQMKEMIRKKRSHRNNIYKAVQNIHKGVTKKDKTIYIHKNKP